MMNRRNSGSDPLTNVIELADCTREEVPGEEPVTEVHHHAWRARNSEGSG